MPFDIQEITGHVPELLKKPVFWVATAAVAIIGVYMAATRQTASSTEDLAASGYATYPTGSTGGGGGGGTIGPVVPAPEDTGSTTPAPVVAYGGSLVTQTTSSGTTVSVREAPAGPLISPERLRDLFGGSPQAPIHLTENEVDLLEQHSYSNPAAIQTAREVFTGEGAYIPAELAVNRSNPAEEATRQNARDQLEAAYDRAHPGQQ